MPFPSGGIVIANNDATATATAVVDIIPTNSILYIMHVLRDGNIVPIAVNSSMGTTTTTNFM